MEKNTPKKTETEKTVKKSLSIKHSHYVFIEEEIARFQTRYGYTIAVSAVVDAALDLLRAERAKTNGKPNGKPNGKH